MGLARLVLPVECPGCGLADVRWCDECEAPWWQEPLRCETGAPRLDACRPPLPVWSVTALEGSPHDVLAAWKDSGRRDLAALLLPTMRRAAAAVAPALRGGAPGTRLLSVVPCPARPPHTRARGVDIPLELARAAVAGLRDRGQPAAVVPALRAGAGGARAAGDRGRWRIGAPRVTAQARRLERPAAALLVDDVITTGSTLARAAGALETAHIVAVAGLVLASAPAVSAPGSVGVL